MNDKLLNKETNALKNAIIANEKTELAKKKAFINEIRNGLGEKIKNNGNKIEYNHIKKHNFLKRMVAKILKIF